MVPSSLELLPFTAQSIRRFLSGATGIHHRLECFVTRMCLEPLIGETVVEQRPIELGSLNRIHVDEFMQWIRGPTRAARRCAHQCKSFDALGGGHCNLLGNHATEADTGEAECGPTKMICYGESVGCIVRHRIRTRRNRSPTESALVVTGNVQVRSEHVEEGPRSCQGGTRSVEK